MTIPLSTIWARVQNAQIARRLVLSLDFLPLPKYRLSFNTVTLNFTYKCIQYIAACSCCPSWIGASDQDNENVFQWTNKENVEFTNWLSTEPSNSNGNEHCVGLCSDGLWNDEYCGKNLNIICERDIFLEK